MYAVDAMKVTTGSLCTCAPSICALRRTMRSYWERPSEPWAIIQCRSDSDDDVPRALGNLVDQPWFSSPFRVVSVDSDDGNGLERLERTFWELITVFVWFSFGTRCYALLISKIYTRSVHTAGQVITSSYIGLHFKQEAHHGVWKNHCQLVTIKSTCLSHVIDVNQSKQYE